MGWKCVTETGSKRCDGKSKIRCITTRACCKKEAVRSVIQCQSAVDLLAGVDTPESWRHDGLHSWESLWSLAFIDFG